MPGDLKIDDSEFTPCPEEKGGGDFFCLFETVKLKKKNQFFKGSLMRLKYVLCCFLHIGNEDETE